MTEPTAEKPSKPRIKRTYAERQRELRDAELKHVEKLKEREQRAFDAYQAATRLRVDAESALNAPIDPDMQAAVAKAVPQEG